MSGIYAVSHSPQPSPELRSSRSARPKFVRALVNRETKIGQTSKARTAHHGLYAPMTAGYPDTLTIFILKNTQQRPSRSFQQPPTREYYDSGAIYRKRRHLQRTELVLTALTENIYLNGCTLVHLYLRHVTGPLTRVTQLHNSSYQARDSGKRSTLRRVLPGFP